MHRGLQQLHNRECQQSVGEINFNAGAFSLRWRNGWL
jgi:hypothetical protein